MTLTSTEKQEIYNTEVNIDLRYQVTLMCVATLNQFNEQNELNRFKFYVVMYTDVYIKDTQTDALYYYDSFIFTNNEAATTKLSNFKEPYFKKALEFAYSQITV